MKSNQSGNATPEKQGTGPGQKTNEISRKKKVAPVNQPAKKGTHKNTPDPEEMEEGTTLTDRKDGQKKQSSNRQP